MSEIFLLNPDNLRSFMDFIISVLIIFAVIMIFSFAVNNQRYTVKTGNAVLKKTADIMSLRFVKGGIFNEPKVLGVSEGLNVFAGWNKINKRGGSELVFEIGVRFHLPVRGKLRLAPRQSGVPLADFEIVYSTVQTGDINYDFEIETGYSGSPDNAIAISTSDVRSEILSLNSLSDYVRVSQYGIHVYNLKIDTGSADVIVSYLKRIIAFAKLLLSYDDFKKLHIHNILHDHSSGVRLNNLKMITSHYPVDNEIDALLNTCLRDEDLHLQFEAAKHVRPGGMEHILNMMKTGLIADEKTLLEAVRFFGDTSFKGASDYLVEVFGNNHRENVRLQILSAIRKTGDEKLSPFLVSLLDSRDSDIVGEAVAALATCGDINAVEKLLKAGEHSINPFFRNSISEAVAGIQSRLGDAEEGWLSVSETGKTEGQLSLAGAGEAGSLSILDSELKN